MGIDQDIPDKERKRDQNYVMAKFLSAIISIEGLVMTFINYRQNKPGLVIFTLCYAAFFAFVCLYTVLTKKLKLFYFSIIGFTFSFEVVFLIRGGADGFGPIWIAIVPLFAVYLFGFFNYLITNTIIFIILVVFLWTPLRHSIYPYTEIFAFRFPVVYLLEFGFGIFLKYRIEKTEKNLEKQKNTLQKEIQHAALIQKTFLSKEKQFWEQWSLSVKSIPMAGVTGDLYCIFGDKHVLNGVGLFDISGHGIASGLLTMLAKNIIEYQFNDNLEAKGKEELWETVDKMNDRFINEKGDVANYLTGLLIKITGNKLELVNAGHPEPILYKKAANSFVFYARDLRSTGAIGMTDLPAFYISQELEMESGDELFIFTDGLTECMNKDGEQFGEKRLMHSFQQYINTSIEEQTKFIIEDINKFRGNKITDDMTLLILKKD